MGELDRQLIGALAVPPARIGLGLMAALLLVFSAAADTPPAGVSGEEWTSIQSQIENEHLKITDSDRAGAIYRADSPSQRFTAHFGAEALSIVPRGGGKPAWQLDLQLTAWGAAHDLKQVNFASVTSEANRVDYRRGALTEWYVNKPMGLEQGFTIDAPPGDDIDELVLEMTISGDLTAGLAESGQAVTFRHGDSSTHLTYSGLKAWNAVEEPLEARMELVGDGKKLQLVVGVAGAAWPVVVDPIFVTVAKIPSPLDPNPSFGNLGVSIAIDGDWMVVGRLGYLRETTVAAQLYRRDQGDPNTWEPVIEIAPDDLPNGYHIAVGISGDVVIIGVQNAGAYLFQRDHGGPSAWGQVATIDPDDDLAWYYGVSVAISGDTAIVGAYGADNFDGAAYVFQHDPGGSGSWRRIKKITGPNPGVGERFGSSVALDTDTAIIGSAYGLSHVYYRDHGGNDNWGHVAANLSGTVVAISGDIAVVGRTGVNSANVFQRHQGGTDAWGHVAEITTDVVSFGNAVAIDGSIIAVGEFRHDANGLDSGAAFVFERDHGGADTWGQVATILPSNAMESAEFGYSLAIEGDSLVVGAPDHYDGVDGSGRGAVYVFNRDQGGTNAWGELQRLLRLPFLNAWFRYFGASVSIDGDTAVIGSPDDLGVGWAHIFRRTPGESATWERITRFTADDDDSPWGDHFGWNAAISADTVIVGAHSDEYHDPYNNIWADVGSAYIFQRNHGGIDNWGLVARVFEHTLGLFGKAVAIDGDIAIVGGDGSSYYGIPPAHIFERNHDGADAWGHVTELVPSDAQTYEYRYRNVAVSGDTAVVGSFDIGSVYIFNRDQGGPGSWGESTKIVAGKWVMDLDISDDTLIVGCPMGPQEEDVALIYRRDHGGPDNWGKVAELRPHNNTEDQSYGRSVSIDGNVAVVGSFDPSENGAIYAYHRDQGGPDAWGEIAWISGFDADTGFGASISVSDGTTLVGARLDEEVGLGAGATYIFEIIDAFFADGFELGDTSAWSVTVP